MGCGTVPEENKPMRQEPLLRSAREQERIDRDEENAQKRARRTEIETETETEEEEERESFTSPQARRSQFVRTTTCLLYTSDAADE